MEELNIIESAPENKLDNRYNFMPHIPVIKMNSETLKVRPVFDASAKEKANTFLNKRSFKDFNLPEFITIYHWKVQKVSYCSECRYWKGIRLAKC